jgi:hypothetical protein
MIAAIGGCGFRTIRIHLMLAGRSSSRRRFLTWRGRAQQRELQDEEPRDKSGETTDGIHR